jgi:hypothetical protein
MIKANNCIVTTVSVSTLFGLMGVGLALPICFFRWPVEFYWLNFSSRPYLIKWYSILLCLFVLAFMLSNAYRIEKKGYLNDFFMIIFGYMVIMFSIICGYALLYTYFLPPGITPGIDPYFFESAKTFATLGMPSFKINSPSIFMKIQPKLCGTPHHCLALMTRNNEIVLFTAIAETLLAHVVTVFYLSIVLYRYSTAPSGNANL